MFKRKNEEKQYKYSLRKIRGRGGVASCIIGAVVFGSFLVQSVVLADTDVDVIADHSASEKALKVEENLPFEGTAALNHVEDGDVSEVRETVEEVEKKDESSTNSTSIVRSSNREAHVGVTEMQDLTPDETEEAEVLNENTAKLTSKKDEESATLVRNKRALNVPVEEDNTGKVISEEYNEADVIRISRPEDYPMLPTTRDYNPDTYYIFKEIISKTYGLDIFAAVKVGDESKTIYLFNQYGQLLNSLVPNESFAQYNIKITNYGDTYAIKQTSGRSNLYYGYSSDGEKGVVAKNQPFDAITGVVPEKSKVTVEYVDQEGEPLLPKITEDALAGEIRNISSAPAIEGYVLTDDSGYQKGEVSLYTEEKVGHQWTRRFGIGLTGNRVDAVYTLLDQYGTFLVQMYTNGRLFAESTIAPGESFTKTIYSNKHDGTAADTYAFPSPYIPDSGGLIYHYTKVGKIIPVTEEGEPIPDAPTPSYRTDPNDPENVIPNQETPDIPGYEKSTEYVTPEDPTVDTPVVYTRIRNGVLTVEYVDRTTNQLLDSTGDSIQGRYGEVINYSTAEKILYYTNRGYKLVEDGFTQEGKTFSDDNNKHVYKVILEHGLQEYTPENPGTPDTPINPENPDGPKVPGDAARENLAKDVSQTVHYTGAGENTPADNVINVKDAFTRSIKVDKVTGEIIERKDWAPNKHAFEIVATPKVVNYYADKDQAGGLTATVENPNVVDDVVYAPKEGTLTVRYLDQDKDMAEIEGTGSSIGGNYGDTINYSTQPIIDELIKKGYELVSDGFTESGKTFSDDNKGQTYDVILKHGVREYTPEAPGTPDTPINPGDPDGPKVPGEAARENLAKDASQTVHYTGAGENTPADNVIRVKDAFARSIKVDKVTGTIIERKDWTPNEHAFEIVATPEVVNYYANKDQAGGLTATVENPSVVDNVVYAPKEGTLTVRYLDQDKGMAEIEDTRGEDSGNYGNPITYSTAETIANLIKKGFELVSDGFTGKAGEVFGDDNKGQIYDVVLKHGITEYTPENPGNPDTPINPENPDGPKVPEDAARENLAKDASQTIRYTGAGENTPADNVIHVKDAFTRSIKVDKVTGEIIERKDWTPNEHTFETVATPEVVNYYADKGQAGGLTATVENPNVVDNVVYAPKEGTLAVRYLDQDKDMTEIEGTGSSIGGNYGDTINYSTQPTIDELLKKGYELVSDGFKESGKTFGDNNKGQTYDVVLKHGITEYTPENPGTPDTPINPENPDGPKVPGDAARENLAKDASQTVHYTGAGENTPADNVINVKDAFTRSIKVDKVTGEIIERKDWTPNEHAFETVATPEVVNYYADKDQAGGLTATVENPNVVDNVVYAPKEGTLTVRYLDQDKDMAEIEGTGSSIGGNYGDTINYSTQPTIDELLKKGYELVSDGFTESGKTFGDDNKGQTYDVILKHGITEYTPENPGTPDTPINPEDPDGPKVPGDAARENLAKDASQTVHYTGAGENTPADNVINVKDAFTRSIKVDKVTGEIIERKDWAPNKHAFETVATPEVVNYYADKAQAGGLTATVENPNVVDDVVYAPKEGTLTVRYLDQDKDMTEIEGTGSSIGGNYGDTINYSTQPTIDELIKKGYELVSDGFTGKAGEVFGDDNKGQTYDVVLKHGITEYTPENPGNPDTPINPEDPDGPKVPEDAARENLAKDASQTIHYTGAGENTPADNVIHAKDAFTRSIKVDKVTGEIIERKDWTPNEHAFETVATPEVVNYYADKAQAGGLTATVENPNVTDEVHYTPLEGALVIRYLDQDNNNQEIPDTRSTIGGNYGDKISYSTQPTIDELIKRGYELVSDGFTGKVGEVFGDNNKGQTYDVVLKHGITEYTPENPGTPDTPINPEDPDGPKVPGDAARENLAKDASQTVHYTGAGVNTPMDNVINVKDAFTRSIKVDKVTGEIIERKDWTPNEHAFETVATPEVVNYYADKAQAGGLTATVENPNVVDNVVYAPKEGTLTVRYLDQDKDMTEIEGTGSSIGGNYGDTINYSTQPTIDELIKKGYDLVSDGFTESGKTFSDDNKGQTYDVILKHGVREYTPEDPGTPDTPINPGDPDGPKVPGEAARENLAKDASQTIHYIGAGENTPADNVITAKDAFTRSIKVDKVTGKILSETKWYPNNHPFDKVATPSVVYFLPDKVEAGGLIATVDNPNVIDQVVYVSQEGALTIRYLDLNNGLKVIPGTGGSVNGKYGERITYTTQPTIDELVKKGYELIIDGFTGHAGDTFNDENKGKTYDVILKHGVDEYTPDKPGTPGTPINPDDPHGPKVPEDAARENLAKDASQTIYYSGAGDKTPANHVTYVKDAFTRSIKVDKVTGEIVEQTEWQPGNHVFDQVVTPEIAKYTADKVQAGGLVATVENPDVVDHVVYVQNSVPTPPRVPNTGGNPTPQPQPTPQRVVQETPRRSSRHLPKTGSKENTTTAGLATVSMAGLLGLISKRRRKED
ncbi:mucin-binding protein [Enterococcus cecorum]|uniref:mucin-binding protein n=1 Tax=Enterococcus cecorum TaxID=44008 RepID=UPI000A869175|nr:MucBP domain-containing protein [Enterococcus cecorum]CAI3340506.1 LPXTG cell wall anchor domain-containing protein [Enterococcus cecorum]